MGANIGNVLPTAESLRLEEVQAGVDAVLCRVPRAHRALFLNVSMPGPPPRLWIDALSFVEMAQDGQTYLFHDGLRRGEVQTARRSALAGLLDAITDYVVLRVIDREKEEEAAKPSPGERSGLLQMEGPLANDNLAAAHSPGGPSIVLPAPAPARVFLRTMDTGFPSGNARKQGLGALKRFSEKQKRPRAARRLSRLMVAGLSALGNSVVVLAWLALTLAAMHAASKG